MKNTMKTMDGNEAAAYASYAFTDIASIYPITPSTPMAEIVDQWSSQGMKNIFGQSVKVVEMQSEGGAAGTLHGALQAGALTTTYTASQGLLLMIPNLYKCAGELLPAVFHVTARALATHALSIFGDHQDVMAVRQTGVCMLASSNCQEVMDLGCISHLSAIKGRLPFVHFFDGFRTSHEIQKIETIDYDDLSKIVDYEAVKSFRDRALSPEHPVVRGTAQNPDIYFQQREGSNRFYEDIPQIVENYMNEIKKLTGREYHPFNYYGDKDAEYIIVAMGSVCDTIEETVEYLMSRGEKVGIVTVHLYRPFSLEYFFKVLPESVKKIAVLDRTKEPGALAEPLYLDIVKAFNGRENKPVIIGGRYGLGSKDTDPSQIISVYKNLKKENSKDGFTIGIIDDVTNTSLEYGEKINILSNDTISCKFWGLGSDGTVGANKSAIKIIGDNTDLYAQAYFSYDSKKSGGSTVSHLRFGKKIIKAPYLVSTADYIACHNTSFVYSMDLVKGLKNKGTFVLNCPWEKTQEIEENIPANIKKYITENEIHFYVIDAVKIARDIGLGSRINMIMQAVFFKLAGVIPIEDAVEYLKESIQKTYGKKGESIVKMNKLAVDEGLKGITKIETPKSWINIKDEEFCKDEEPAFVKKIQRVMAKHEGDSLTVKDFEGMEDGTFPLGTTKYEKRGIGVYVPEWQMDKCIQCNQCSFICPHATIRPILLDQNEEEKAPQTFHAKTAMGKEFEKLKYRIQVSPLDCVGCGNCADICPAPGKALVMKPVKEQIKNEAENWEYAVSVSDKSKLVNINSIRGSQFVTPLLEFNGACPGCGETAYVKLLTQLFGTRMMIANATGCSSIWGGSAPAIPYTTNAEGKGPAWANSLFEDNAEFGYGMFLGVKHVRDRLEYLMSEAIKSEIPDSLKDSFKKWIEFKEDGDATRTVSEKIINEIKSSKFESNKLIQEILDKKDYLVKRSQWMIGGDGWAYDIGFGGVDQVLSLGDDVNILVLDTEIYSNTGGQSSKSTPTGSVAKFAYSGKKASKKNLAMMAMTYGNVFVGQIAIGANMNHAIKILAEAERYKGPSIIIAYAPCISHGIKTGMGTSVMQQKKAVKSGYWHLFKYDPLLKVDGKRPFVLDSGEPTEGYVDYINSELRYSSLNYSFPQKVKEMQEQSRKNAEDKLKLYKMLADTDF